MSEDTQMRNEFERAAYDRCKALESERDALQEQHKSSYVAIGLLTKDRDIWRSLCEKLAEALKEAEYQVHQQKYGACLMTLEDAQRDYDAAKRGTK